MNLKLVAYEHTVRDWQDEAELIFEANPLPDTRLVPIDRVHPDVLAALKAHLTGVSDVPVHYRIFALAGEFSNTERDQIFVQLDRISPSSAEQISAPTRMHDAWIAGILAAIG